MLCMVLGLYIMDTHTHKQNEENNRERKKLNWIKRTLFFKPKNASFLYMKFHSSFFLPSDYVRLLDSCILCGCLLTVKNIFLLLWITRKNSYYVNQVRMFSHNLFFFLLHFDRKQFLIRNTSMMRKNDSIALIKHMGHLYSLLCGIMDNLNYCYSFQVIRFFSFWHFLWMKEIFNQFHRIMSFKNNSINEK